ncbi:MAG: hypothetical protein WD398_11505 [Cyclobacteriaceae bacterium]
MKFKDIRIWIFIFGIMFLIGSYLYQHSQTNQEQLKSQGIKGIYLAKNNFIEAFYNYHVQLEGYLKRNFYKWTLTEKDNAAIQLVNRIDRDPKFEIESIRLNPDEHHKIPPFGRAMVELWQRDSSYFISVKDYQFSLNEKKTDGSLPTENLSILSDSLFYNWGLKLENDTINARNFRVDHLVPIHLLMENNIQSLFFDDLFVLNKEGKVLYPRTKAGISISIPDSVHGTSSLGESSFRLRISEKDYEGFISPATVGNKTLYLMGVKETAQFQRVAFRIDFNLLSSFLTILILVFVAIPIISIFNMSAGDVLTKKRVFGLGLSLIVVMVILGFFSFSLVQNYRSFGPADDHIKALKSVFNKEINSLKTNLDQFDELYHHDSVRKVSFPLINSNVNEFLQFDEEGRIVTMMIPDEEKDPEPIFFWDFPFLSIANRDYVKELATLNADYFTSAHFSKSTGNLEGVISKKKGKTGSAVTFRLDKISPTISPFQRYFIFKPEGKVILKSEKVAIPINHLEEGIGQDKWQEIRTLIKNNQNAAADQVWEIPIYVNGHEYQALLSRIPSDFLVSDNWLLYLEDKNLQHTLHSLASLEAITVFFPYLMVLVLLSLFTMMVKKSSIYLAFEGFSFQWYSPSPQKRGRFLWLNYILALDILLYIFVYLCIPLCVFKIYLWACLFAVQAGTCNFLMLYSKSSEHIKENINGFLVLVSFLWLCFAGTMIYFSMMSLEGPYILLTIGVIILLGGLQVLCYLLSKANKLPSLTPTFISESIWIKKWHGKLTLFWNRLTQVKVDKRIYALNFLLWLVIIGFLPGYFIHRQIFNQEKFIWDNAYQSKESKDVGGKCPNGLYEDLIHSLEKFRRTNFGRFTHLEDEKVKSFIAPPKKVYEDSFFQESNFEKMKKPAFPEDNSIGFWENAQANAPVWIILLLIMVWLFNMIMRLSNKIYLIDYHFAYNNEIQIPKSVKKTKKSFLIGIDSEKTRSWVIHQFELDSKELLVIDAKEEEIQLLPLKNYHKAVMLENLHCFETIDKMIETLVKFKGKYEKKELLLLVSSGKPLQEILQGKIPNQKLLVITELFATYLFQFVPLHYQNPRLSLPYMETEWKLMSPTERSAFQRKVESQLFNDRKLQEITDDLSYSPNSQSIASLITLELSKDPLDQPLSQERFEKCILSLQRYNKSYFMNIWSEMSGRERKMVYNYANEGFINFYNKETMTALIQKGILKMNRDLDGLVLFSQSFRNFVCVFVSDEEISRFKQDERKSGNAKMIQAAAISFVFISLALIGYYDPSVLNETSAYISAFLGLAGTAYSLIIKGLGKKLEQDPQ